MCIGQGYVGGFMDGHMMALVLSYRKPLVDNWLAISVLAKVDLCTILPPFLALVVFTLNRYPLATIPNSH